MMLQLGMQELFGVADGLWSWLSPKASVIGDLGDFVFFKFVLERLQHDIRVFGEGVLGRVMTFVSFLALTVLTLWVLIQGYRMVTGQLRESAMALVANTLKAVFIVAVALSFGMANDTVTQFLTDDMKNGIHELITGNPGAPEDEIDANLGWMQVAMSSMDALDSGGDLDGNAQKERAQMFIGFGTGGPAITAGALLLMYQVAMALFVGLGPIFILCLLFDYTKGLFQKWLFYGIGTMFSMAVLSAMVTIALKMVTDVAVAMWASDAISTLLLGGGEMVSYSSRAMQAGSMGMILTLLLITVPPMAAAFFNGTMGNFMHFSAFGAGMATAPSANGPAGSPMPSGYQPTTPVNDVARTTTNADQTVRNYGTPTHSASGLPVTETGPKQNVAPLREQQGGDYAAMYTAAPGGTARGGETTGYAAENPGARGAANGAPAGGPQQAYAPSHSSDGPTPAPPQSTPPPGSAPVPSAPQAAPPVGTTTRVAGSQPAQPFWPTNAPPPPPKDRG